MTSDRNELVIVEQSNGFAVHDMSVPRVEFHNWGILCEGCPTREDAEKFITEYIAEQRAIADRAKKAKDEPLPF